MPSIFGDGPDEAQWGADDEDAEQELAVELWWHIRFDWRTGVEYRRDQHPHCDADSNGASPHTYGHKHQDRRESVITRAAALSTAPPPHPVEGGTDDRHKQIFQGAAVLDGRLAVGQLALLAVMSLDSFACDTADK